MALIVPTSAKSLQKVFDLVQVIAIAFGKNLENFYLMGLIQYVILKEFKPKKNPYLLSTK